MSKSKKVIVRKFFQKAMKDTGIEDIVVGKN
jgi:hypothetical protein